MLTRFPSLLALFVALFAGAMPLQVCAHADEEHARVQVPTAGVVRGGPVHGGLSHSHAAASLSRARARCGEHGTCTGHGHRASPERSAPPAPRCPLGHVPDCPACPDQGHCHCSDARLLTGAPFVTVTLPSALLVLGWTTSTLPDPLASVPVVAPLLLEGLRVPHESDSIVLIR